MAKIRFILVCCLGLTACHDQKVTKLMPLSFKTFQSRHFEDPLKQIFTNALRTFENLGYTIIAADEKTGFISAEGMITSPSEQHQNKKIRGMAFIETTGKNTSIQLNIVETLRPATEKKQPSLAKKPALQQPFYDNFFSSLRESSQQSTVD